MLPYMEALGTSVQAWLHAAGLSATSAARRAGVSASTLHRVLHNQVDPSVGTLSEIAFACGFSLDLATKPVSDGFAAAAARAILEDGYQPPAMPGVMTWQRRLLRWAAADDAITIVQAAAKASSPLRREHALLLSGKETLARLASAGDASSGNWALSGAAGLDPGSSVAPSVTILWCDDQVRVAQLLTNSALRPTKHVDRASLAVVPAEPELFYDSFSVGGVRFAAPIQIIIDCLAQDGPVAEAAFEEAATW